MIRHFFTRQFLRFLLVGGTAAFLHWSARILLSLWLPFGWAVALAYAVGIVIAFVLNRIFVFPQSTKPIGRQGRDFILINLAFFPVVWAAALAIDKALKSLSVTFYPEAIAHAIAVALPMAATFLIYKFFAFKDTAHGQQ